MRFNRFFINLDLKQEQVVVADKEILNQLKNVLRLKKGDKIILADGNLNEALFEIKDYEKDCVSGRILEINKNKNEADMHGILYCSILKRENFELVAQKATEIGISEIVPIITERTVKLNLNYERLEKIIREAGEQSGRGRLPVLQKAIKFEEAVESAKNNDLNLFFDSSGVQFKNLSASWRTEKLKAVGVWVGPEGGWTDNELKHIRTETLKDRFEIVSLGKTTLRAETAAIVASFYTLI